MANKHRIQVIIQGLINIGFLLNSKYIRVNIIMDDSHEIINNNGLQLHHK